MTPLVAQLAALEALGHSLAAASMECPTAFGTHIMLAAQGKAYINAAARLANMILAIGGDDEVDLLNYIGSLARCAKVDPL